MRKVIFDNFFLIILLAIGVIASLILCTFRAEIEANDKEISVVMSKNDIENLSEMHNITYAEYAEILTNSAVVIIENEGEINEELNLFLGSTYNGENATIGLIEDEDQYSFVPINGFEYNANSDVVRVFKYTPKVEINSENWGYDGNDNPENIAYRAITDRNIRVLWLTPFFDTETGEIISDPQVYTDMISSLSERINKHGISIDKFTKMPPYQPNSFLIIAIILGISAAGVLLINSLFSLTKKLKTALSILAFAALSIAQVINPALVSLASSIAFPCLSIWYIVWILTNKEHFSSKKDMIFTYILTITVAFFIATIGGFSVGALNSSRAYLLAVENFRGVKLSQIAPLIYAFLISFKCFYKRKNFKEIFTIYLKNKVILTLLIIGIFTVSTVFLLRTGDDFLTASTLELDFRNFLEHTLIARPRTKEFLFAYPILALGIVFLAHKYTELALPFTALSSVGFASIVNTFCHSRAPLWLSFTRSITALFFGILIGIILILLSKKTAITKLS